MREAGESVTCHHSSVELLIACLASKASLSSGIFFSLCTQAAGTVSGDDRSSACCWNEGVGTDRGQDGDCQVHLLCLQALPDQH